MFSTMMKHKNGVLLLIFMATIVVCLLHNNSSNSNNNNKNPYYVDCKMMSSRDEYTRRMMRMIRGGGDGGSGGNNNLLVVGSMNVDTFLPVSRLPVEGENLTVLPNVHPKVDVAGGKGCNQAIACAKLLHDTDDNDNERRRRVSFVGQFGNDDAATLLKSTLLQHHVQLTSLCQTSKDIPSGRGYVFLQASSGKVSAIVSGGSNSYAWNNDWKQPPPLITPTTTTTDDDDIMEEDTPTSAALKSILKDTSCVLLQREVPEYVNWMVATLAKQQQNNNNNKKDIIVIQDVGGEDRSMTSEMMSLCDYLIPNATELKRLVQSIRTNTNNNHHQEVEEPSSTAPQQTQTEEDMVEWAIQSAKLLQTYGGANHIIVTLGDKGSVFIHKDGTTILHQPACPISFPIIDETGAGDCYRAAFAVALSSNHDSNSNNNEHHSSSSSLQVIQTCMQFASAAGALAVSKQGAVPSIPTRQDVDALCRQSFIRKDETTTTLPRGGADAPAAANDNDNDDEFPLLFGSRLNSMKDRPELWDRDVSSDVREWVRRQGTIQGLGCVDFNYPQHFVTNSNSNNNWNVAHAKEALEDVGLVAGAVCLRYPSKFARGAMNHPDPTMRREAIDITKQAAQVAIDLGCNEVVIWSAYDGYDYPFQVHYPTKWQQLVEAFQECCDAYPTIRWSLEFKPTDENTRFFTVPSTGAALLLVREINRPNMGLTLDMGHMLMAGENPGQSISMVGDKLFGIQLNDGYTRLAAEDGMIFGSVHPSMALEALYQIQHIQDFKGHLYFDTFPQRTDPVKEAEYNIARVKQFWKAASKLDAEGIQTIMEQHDAIGALEAIDRVLQK